MPLSPGALALRATSWTVGVFLAMFIIMMCASYAVHAPTLGAILLPILILLGGRYTAGMVSHVLMATGGAALVASLIVTLAPLTP